MAYSYIEHTYNGVYVFNIPFEYLDKDDIVLYINDELRPKEEIIWLSDSSIRLVSELTLGDKITIVRSTSVLTPVVDYKADAVLDEESLDKSNLQNLYLNQETRDMFNDPIGNLAGDYYTKEEIDTIITKPDWDEPGDIINRPDTYNGTGEPSVGALVALDNAAKLPALDASNLINIPGSEVGNIADNLHNQIMINTANVAVTNDIGSVRHSGTLTIGAYYRILNYVEGDNFLNVGAKTQLNKETFQATGTIPTSWSHGSALQEFEYVIHNGNLVVQDYQQATDFLSLTNVNPYTPTGDYHPATKKYVDDNSVNSSNYLAKDNTEIYLPTENYNPATKKYVDDNSVNSSNYLAKDNINIFTPTGDYNPATKKYVDDAVINIGGLDSEMLFNNNGTEDGTEGLFWIKEEKKLNFMPNITLTGSSGHTCNLIYPQFTGSTPETGSHFLGQYIRMQAPEGAKTFMYGVDVDLIAGAEQKYSDNNIYDVNGYNVINQGKYRCMSGFYVAGGHGSTPIVDAGDNPDLFSFMTAIEMDATAQTGLSLQQRMEWGINFRADTIDDAGIGIRILGSVSNPNESYAAIQLRERHGIGIDTTHATFTDIDSPAIWIGNGQKIRFGNCSICGLDSELSFYSPISGKSTLSELAETASSLYGTDITSESTNNSSFTAGGDMLITGRNNQGHIKIYNNGSELIEILSDEYLNFQGDDAAVSLAGSSSSNNMRITPTYGYLDQQIDIGLPTYRFRNVYANAYYDNGGGYNDTLDDLAILHAMSSKGSTEDCLNKDGHEVLDVHSLPDWMTNKEEIKKQIKQDNGDLITDADLEEYLLDDEELGWMKMRDITKFNDITAGAVRQLDRKVNDLIRKIEELKKE